MREDTNDIPAARDRLCAQIDRLAHELPRLSRPALCTRIDELRRVAATHRLAPAATVAGSLSALLAAKDRLVPVRPYLEALREAAGCERADAAAGEAFLAAVGLRLAY